MAAIGLERVRGGLVAGALLFGMATQAATAEITVFAAASLQDVFQQMAQAFETLRPRDRVNLVFGAAGELERRMAKGERPDVFASDDAPPMDRAVAAALVDPASRADFARNQLVVVVPAVSSIAWRGLTDLARLEVKRIAIGDPETVPAGRHAREVMQTARIWADVRERLLLEPDVRRVLDRLARNEADAGFVYATDSAQAVNRVLIVERPATGSPIVYPIAVLREAPQPEAAAAFAALVRGETGRRILAAHGFLPP